ncbi:hypothetical protein PSC71_05995 [Devosia sp. J2-20]|uniref:hypothetical protein n=1 Tax=Devosia sp. J2-20 TaxID=3026161 RepID=UPI00249B169B|nr:hypothetical protein [Devosia sp. J2-20]WDR00321.1 hypothetical protein PSC71_05995 [Devosia sp. J2-20]
MKRLFVGLALSAMLSPTAFAFDTATQAIVDLQKSGKPVQTADLVVLMQASERWCYVQQAASCAWSDIYLDVNADGAQFEISNAWSEAVEIAFIDTGRFEDGRMICETGVDWLPTIRAIKRADGSIIGGRALHDLKAEIGATAADTTIDCFDYRYLGADAEARTITLLQRQSREGVHDPDQDTEVTLHFNPATAAALTLRW